MARPSWSYVTHKGEEPKPHTHATEDEMFYVMSASAAVMRRSTLLTAASCFLPRGIEHEYAIRSDGPVRLLVVTAAPRHDTDGWDGFIGGMKRRFGTPA